MKIKWSKKLSKTDAQRKTRGYPVPYLRFTQSNHSQDTKTWFRQTFFSSGHWTNGHHGENAVEETHITFDVTIAGKNKGDRVMKVTHDDQRQYNNKTPNTYLHYDDRTRANLQQTDFTGRTVTVSNEDGVYKFTID